MADDRTDCCIVGAGPAGLVLALLLLRSGVRVTVLERARSFDREYRGEILQPGGLALLDELDVLAGARARGAYEHRRFRLVEGGRTLLDIDYRRLPAPYNFLLSIPQRHVLEELLDRCRAFDGFSYLAGTRISELVHHAGRIAGVVGDGPDGRRTVLARCVVGADGRYSKTRTLAGIPAGRLDVFAQDVLWFKLRRRGRARTCASSGGRAARCWSTTRGRTGYSSAGRCRTAGTRRWPPGASDTSPGRSAGRFRSTPTRSMNMCGRCPT